MSVFSSSCLRKMYGQSSNLRTDVHRPLGSRRQVRLAEAAPTETTEAQGGHGGDTASPAWQLFPSPSGGWANPLLLHPSPVDWGCLPVPWQPGTLPWRKRPWQLTLGHGA